MSPLNVIRSLLFYCAFYGGSAGLLIVAMVALAVSPSPLGGFVRNWSRWHRLCLRHLCGIRISESGARLDGPVLYAFKHESFCEAINLPAMFDSPVVFAKQELFKIPAWGRAALAYGLIPVSRHEGAKALRSMVTQARHHSRSGRPLVIFPEGTRIPHGVRAPLQSGFAGIYKLIGLPVVPVAVDSGPLYHRWIKQPGTITVRFGAPIEPGLPRAELEARVLEAINALNPR